MAPAACVSAILFAAALSFNVFQFLSSLTILLVFTLYISVLGMYFNAKYPRYDWTSEQQAVKQGLSLIFTMLTGLATFLLFTLASAFLIQVVLWVQIFAVCFLLVLTFIAQQQLKKRRLYM